MLGTGIFGSTLVGREPWLVLGLGHHGERYERTRGNIGHLCIDRLLSSRKLVPNQTLKFSQLVHAGGYPGVLFAKNQTPMNESGKAIEDLFQRYTLTVGRLIIITYDRKSPLGTVGFAPGGTSDGHVGLADINDLVIDIDYPRILAGITRQDCRPITDLLDKFDDEEESTLDQVLDRVVQVTEEYLAHGVDAGIKMNDSWGTVAHEEPAAWQIARAPQPSSSAEPERAKPERAAPEWTDAQQWPFGGAAKRRKRWWRPW